MKFKKLLLTLAIIPAISLADDFYSKGSPFKGIHGNPKNNTYIPVTLRNHYSKVYDTLNGYKVFQPMSFSPDGKIFYVTAHDGDVMNSYVFAVDKDTGKILWQKLIPQSAGGSPIVDIDGKIYVAGKGVVECLNDKGESLWKVVTDEAGFGMHMDSKGYLLIVTLKGTLYKISRDGKIVDFINLPDTYNFDHGIIYPGKISGVASIIGINGFTSNTLAIDDKDRVFVVGKSDRDNYGSIIRVKSEGIKLIPDGFGYVYKGQNTGATPAISPDNKYIIVSGGDELSNGYYAAYSTDTLEKIDEFPLSNGVSKGSPAVDNDNCVYNGDKGIFYKTCLVENKFKRYWAFNSGMKSISSVYTVTNNQVLFQISNRGKNTPIYSVGVDREDGKLVWEVENPEISMSTIVIDNDLDLYVTMGGGKVGVTKLH